MSWKEQLQPASFKGVKFFVEDIDIKSGRRIVNFEFPKLSTPATEDMGRKQRTFSVQGYILGDDYISESNRLLDACESEGAGDLIHPFRGEKRVQCEEIVLKESMKEGGIVLISMSFVEAGEELYPSPTADQLASMQKSKLAAIESAKEDFMSKYSVSGKGQLLINSASSQVTSWSDKFNTAMKSVKGESESIADLGYSIRNLKANSLDLVTAPGNLSNQLVENVSGLAKTLSFEKLGAALGAYRYLYKTDNSATYVSNPQTQTRKQERTNQKAVDDLVKNVAVLEASEQAAQSNYSSYEDAIAMQEELLEQLDNIIENTDNDNVYLNFSQVRAQVVELIPARDKNLPELMKVSLNKIETSLSLSYSLYGNIENEAEIVSRNKIPNPAFIPAEKELEVPSE